MPTIKEQLEQIDRRLEELPKGTLVYKKIKGKEQPYLQRTVDGKSVSDYIRMDERECILAELQEREHLRNQRKILQQYHEKIRSILAKNPYMDRRPSRGIQDFGWMIEHGSFYVDKTAFLKEWWDSGDPVTLITRPRRFGKTLTLSMAEYFFSNQYASRQDLFQNLSISEDADMMQLQGTYPVIAISLSWAKGNSFTGGCKGLCNALRMEYSKHSYLENSRQLSELDHKLYRTTYAALQVSDTDAIIFSIATLSELLWKHYHKKVILLMDEYDTPLQDAYANGYWEEMMAVCRPFFNASFKLNSYYERALITGITRISKNSLFSDLNHLRVVSLFTEKYAEFFGFTEQEVKDILQCQNSDEMQEVKRWYDGFTIGGRMDIYNPWSIICYLDERRFLPYWINTSSNELISRLLAESEKELKEEFELLLQGMTLHKKIQEDIVFQYLTNSSDAIWSLLVVAGYLKVDGTEFKDDGIYGELSVTNLESRMMFENLVRQWFSASGQNYSAFVKALLEDDTEGMTDYLNDICLDMVSFFDVGRRPSAKAPERFYHGLVLGLIVSLKEGYIISSNRESGRGRYDIMLESRNKVDPSVIIEFKVRNPKTEKCLEDTVRSGHDQIEKMEYRRELLKKGIEDGCIRQYTFAFCGKEVLVG